MSENNPGRPRIVLIGPDQTQPCGIADFTSRLAAALTHHCDLLFLPFRQALSSDAAGRCQAILVQFERTLVPGNFLARLSAQFPGKVFVVPHEVYEEDPFAFPYENLRGPFLWGKRLRYRWRHRAYSREKALQRRGYDAHRVIPLSGPSAEVLRKLAGAKVLEPVPHPYFIPPGSSGEHPTEGTVGSWNGVRRVLGIFGFLNPGLDYASALDLLGKLDASTGLLLLGGARNPEGASARVAKAGMSQSWLMEAAAKRGLQDRFRITGYLPEERLAEYFRQVDVFLCPMRFKSNSGSLLNLITLGKPILASDLPLTRYLRDQGAPIELYGSFEEMRTLAEAALHGSYLAPRNRYPWDFDAAAKAYLEAMLREATGAAG